MSGAKRAYVLADFPFLLEPYARAGGFTVSDVAARQWAMRTRKGSMDPPLPEPDLTVGPSHAAAWHAETIISWYCRWKGLDRERIEAAARGEQAAQFQAVPRGR